ncbi:MAG: 2-C-methyl-D-erythritol 4-phosphate cytidylyltransferase [Lachnospiraceae bacterium]|nr:2-C-methyl-D-erythritol 4-phosphate cytidylyltransferase [Lachnospiraceae bacterium]
MTIALLTAAGKGSRMHTEIPKQFLHINNRPIVLYTMEAFQKHAQIDAIIVVTLDAWKDMIWAYARQYRIDKLKWIVTGGETGQESINKGLRALEKECGKDDVIMIHDGNRPLISDEIISDSIATYKKYGSAVAAMPCIEAIYRSSDGEKSEIALDRHEMFRTQTPHTYSLGKLLWAHKKAEEQKISNTTATCTLMSLLGETIYFSKGSEKNLKLTTKEDVDIFEALLEKEKRYPSFYIMR